MGVGPWNYFIRLTQKRMRWSVRVIFQMPGFLTLKFVGKTGLSRIMLFNKISTHDIRHSSHLLGEPIAFMYMLLRRIKHAGRILLYAPLLQSFVVFSAFNLCRSLEINTYSSLASHSFHSNGNSNRQYLKSLQAEIPSTQKEIEVWCEWFCNVQVIDQ